MISETPVQLDQIESWQHALEEGRNLIAEAVGLQVEAKQAQIVKHWHEAAEKFRQAHTMYEVARTRLAVPAAIDANSYRALRLLRDESSELLTQAQDALDEYDRARWVELCEHNILVAIEMQQQAQAALYEGNLDTARALASQAGEIHPALREEAERTVRAAVERAGESNGKNGALMLVVVIAVLLGLLIGAWLYIWPWIAG